VTDQESSVGIGLGRETTRELLRLPTASVDAAGGEGEECDGDQEEEA
jgi:hypothetical protein